MIILRLFVLAQALEYNELSDAIKVKMHDLLGSMEYYSDILRAMFTEQMLSPDVKLCLVAQLKGLGDGV